MMHISALVVGLACSIVSASPIKTKRSLSTNDVNVLQLAHYLENLEFSLYSGGCHNFTDKQYTAAGFPSGFRENVCVIAQHEKIHADTIAAVLESGGQAPLPPCEYVFPYTDPTSFADLANMITSVGIGAYLGGSTLLTDNSILEEEAASILTVEARHDTYLRTGLKGSPFPTAFDTGLTSVFAFNLAQPFVKSCPQQLPLPILPKLSVTAPKPSPHLKPVKAGTPIAFKWNPSSLNSYGSSSGPLYIAMINQNISAPIFQKIKSTGHGTGTVPLPKGVEGAAFAVLTSASGGLTEDALSTQTLAGPAEVIVS